MEPLTLISTGVKTLTALANIHKSCLAIQDVFLLKKIQSFSDEPFDEKVIHNFIDSIDLERWEKIQFSIVHLLTQAESEVKAIYERHLVEALLTKKITDFEFWRMNFILLHIFTFDLMDIKALYNDKDCSPESKQTFAFYKLLTNEEQKVVEGTLDLRPHYNLNEFGKKFVESIGI